MTLMHFTTTMMFLLSFTGLATHRKHLVSALLCIEGMMLALFSTFTLLYQTQNHTVLAAPPIVLLTLAAAGASAGLALLVATARTHASDHLNTMNLLKC